ncbi:MAG: HesB/IscA family protein [Alphaproteobacteria bacterium]
MAGVPIEIKDVAVQRMKTVVKNAEDDVIGLRLSVKTTGCSGHSYHLDYVKQGDDVSKDDYFGDHGVELYIPKVHSWMMFGMTIDYITDDLGNARFDFINPNESSRCGCGESFQIEGKP